MKRILTFKKENADIAKITVVFKKEEYYEFAARIENLRDYLKASNKIIYQDYTEYLEEIIKELNKVESEWV